MIDPAEHFLIKLDRLIQQIKTARLADYAYEDGIAALDILYSRVKSARRHVADSSKLSLPTKTAILRDANFLILRVLHILGIVVRSTSVRNAFELYVPFLACCKALLGSDARLILSSEWQYVPFTHPQSLRDLPDFVVIGLPASESDNALVFPAAGHELGHSVWLKGQLKAKLLPKIIAHNDELFLAKRQELEATYPFLKSADFSQDMFAQHIKSEVITSVLSQAEEYFSDFVGLLIFGESFLYAFSYLISPNLGGARDREYPNLATRASVLEDYADRKLAIRVPDYSRLFVGEAHSSLPREQLFFDLADDVVSRILENIFSCAYEIVIDAKVDIPTEMASKAVEESFRAGVPFDREATMGDLINGAWRAYRTLDSSTYEKQGRESVDYLTDLVLKSVEIHEIRNYLR